MNEFRMGLLRERAEQIRPQLSEARQLAEKAEREGREMTTEERAIYDPVIKSAREIADGAQRPVWNAGDYFGTLYKGRMSPGAVAK